MGLYVQKSYRYAQKLLNTFLLMKILPEQDTDEWIMFISSRNFHWLENSISKTCYRCRNSTGSAIFHNCLSTYVVFKYLYCKHWHKYIWTACSASKSVIKDGRSMRVFAHEVNCWPVSLCIFLCVWRASDVQTTLIFVRIRQYSSAFCPFNW